MLKMKFDFRDIFTAPRMAFSIQRIWIQFAGMFVGYLGYLVFTYLSFVSCGYDIPLLWQKYGLLPCLYVSAEAYPWYAWVLFIVGSLIFFLAYLVANTAVARAVYMIGKGNSFYSWKESYAFAFRKFWSVLMTPVSLVLLIAFLVLGSLVVGLLGKIPFIGELGVSLFTPLWFVSALLIFFFAIILMVSLFLVPAIIATTDEDAFEAVFQVFSVTWSKPWSLIFYQALSLALAVVSFGLFAIAAKTSIVIMNNLFMGFMGGDFINLANNGQAMVQSWTIMLQGPLTAIFGDLSPVMFFNNAFSMIPVSDLGISVVISSYIYAISLLFIGGWVISYGFSTFTSGNTIYYLVLRQQKDQENLLERRDAEEEEDVIEEAEEKEASPEEPEK